MIPILYQAFYLISLNDIDYYHTQDEIAIVQLRKILLTSYNVNCNNDYIEFRYQDKEFIINYVNKKLILQPGTQIFLMDVDNLQFEVYDDVIYLKYTRRNRQYEKIIASSKSYDINYFDNCFDDSDDDSDN